MVEVHFQTCTFDMFNCNTHQPHNEALAHLKLWKLTLLRASKAAQICHWPFLLFFPPFQQHTGLLSLTVTITELRATINTAFWIMGHISCRLWFRTNKIQFKNLQITAPHICGCFFLQNCCRMNKSEGSYKPQTMNVQNPFHMYKWIHKMHKCYFTEMKLFGENCDSLYFC